MAFLIGEGADIDRQARASERDAGHDAERAVEPAGLVLRFDVAADQQVRTGTFVPAIDVADAVDRSIQSAGRQPVHQPAPRFHILRREGRAMHAGAERADLPQFVQVTQEGIRIDR